METAYPSRVFGLTRIGGRVARLPLMVMIAGLIFVASEAGAATDESRIALVIGNSSYKIGRLDNPVNDASAVAAKLEDLGFEVILRVDADRRQMGDAIRDFGDRSRGKRGVALFFYAGHGVQVGLNNYLIPLGADIRREHDIKYSSIDAAWVLEEMKAASNRVNIVILDACRNNPFAAVTRSISPGGGLARMNAPTGSLVAFSTAPGKVAHDGPPGGNSIFTKHLLRHLDSPDLLIEQVFKSVREGVLIETNEEQVPWEESSLIGNFVFRSVPVDEGRLKVASIAPLQEILGVPASPQISASADTTPATASQSTTSQSATAQTDGAAPITDRPDALPLIGRVEAIAADLSFWRSVKNSSSPTDSQRYLVKFPEGYFVLLAKLKLRAAVAAYLERAKAALKEKRLTSPAGDNALHWAERALALDSGNAEAMTLLGRVIDKYLGWAASQYRHDKIANAKGNIRKVKKRLGAYSSPAQLRRVASLDRKIRSWKPPAPVAPVVSVQAPAKPKPQRDRGTGWFSRGVDATDEAY